jgi:hypothetical protein
MPSSRTRWLQWWVFLHPMKAGPSLDLGATIWT